MANREHLKILDEGVESWNAWRRNLDIFPDLSNAKLSGRDLRNLNLYDARLYEADLNGVDMRSANLTRAQLNKADLEGANLHNADVTGANLEDAKFSGATLAECNLSLANLLSTDLRSANLSGAIFLLTNLTWTNLDDANLSEAFLNLATFTGTKLGKTNFTNCQMGATIFADTNLAESIGLESVIHHSPSTLGFDTIFRSKGRIPEIFLRGVGMPMDLIASFGEKPFESHSCFISFSSKDQDFARSLYGNLQSNMIRCWFAPENLKIGDRFRARIEESIHQYDKLLVVLSENSVQSSWVAEEVEAAFERERRQPGAIVLFPIRLDKAVMKTDQAWAATIRRTRHIGDFENWKDHQCYMKAFNQLLRDLKAEATPKTGAPDK